MFGKLLRSREKRRVTGVHGDDLLAGQPLVHPLLQPRADGPVPESSDVHPRYPAEVLFGEGNRRGERGHGLGGEPGLRPLHVFVRAVGEQGFPDGFLPDGVADDPSSLITRFAKINDSVPFSAAESTASPTRDRYAPT